MDSRVPADIDGVKIVFEIVFFYGKTRYFLEHLVNKWASLLELWWAPVHILFDYDIIKIISNTDFIKN